MIFQPTGKDRHPDLREHLWMRASGAAQMQQTYEDYKDGASERRLDYYSALERSPCPPNPSVGTIKADQPRMNFDTDVTMMKNGIKEKFRGFSNAKIQAMMQKKMAKVLISYHKRNGAFVYSQS